MTAPTIKLVIPGGEPYQGALVEGVTKVAARRGFSGPAASELATLVTIGARAINSAEPASIELIIDPHDAHIEVKLTGRGATGNPDADALAAFSAEAEARALSHNVAASPPRVGFDVGAG